MDFYILDENFIEFLSYINIDSPGIIPMWEWYVPSGHFFTTNSIIGKAKCSSSYDKKREYFWPSLMRCNDSLVCSTTIILPKDMSK